MCDFSHLIPSGMGPGSIFAGLGDLLELAGAAPAGRVDSRGTPGDAGEAPSDVEAPGEATELPTEGDPLGDPLGDMASALPAGATPSPSWKVTSEVVIL